MLLSYKFTLAFLLAYGDEDAVQLQSMTICAAEGDRLSEEFANYKRRVQTTNVSPPMTTIEGKPTVRFRTFSDPGHHQRRRHITGQLHRTASGTLKRMRHLSTTTFSTIGPEGNFTVPHVVLLR